MRNLARLIVFGALGYAPPARAQELRYNPDVDIPVTVGGAAAVVIGEPLKRGSAATCTWCDRDAAGNDTLNALDATMRGLRWTRPRLADTLSDVTALATPVLASATISLAADHDGRLRGTGTDLLIVAETGVVAADVNMLVKVLVLRERPDIHFLAEDKKAARTPRAEDDLSFYSGHTSEAVSLAVAAGTVASLRKYRLAPVVWATSLPPALVTGYLRIGADRHYFTDVLVGAVAGAALGVLLPVLFHAPAAPGASTAPTTEGAARASGSQYVLGWSGQW